MARAAVDPNFRINNNNINLIKYLPQITLFRLEELIHEHIQQISPPSNSSQSNSPSSPSLSPLINSKSSSQTLSPHPLSDYSPESSFRSPSPSFISQSSIRSPSPTPSKIILDDSLPSSLYSQNSSHIDN